jgi:hypothetical protein
MKKRRLRGNNSIDYYKQGVPHKQLYYDTAVTGNGKCYFCKKSIPKGTPVFWFWAKFKKYSKRAPATVMSPAKPGITELNIKRKICFRCIEEDIFNHILERYTQEIQKIKRLKKSFKRSIKGKKCKRAIENSLVLEELQKEDFAKNFDFHG